MSEVGAPPRVWPTVVVLLASLLAIFMGSCLLGVVLVVPRTEAGAFDAAALMKEPLFLLLSGALSQGALLGCAVKLPGVLNDVGEGGWRARVAWQPQRFSWPQALVVALGMQATGSFMLQLLALGHVQGGVLTGLTSVARDLGPVGFAVLLLVAAVGPGLGEELMFRGVVQTRVAQRYGPAVGIAVSAALFGLWHFDLRQGLMAAGMGGWIGWCAWRQGTVVNTALAHGLNNAFALTVARLSEPQPPLEARPAVMAGAAAVAVLCGLVMARLTPRAEPATLA